MPTATYDSRRDTFKPLNPPWSEEPDLKTLTTALPEAYPDLAAEVRKRRTTLRTLYRKCEVRNNSAIRNNQSSLTSTLLARPPAGPDRVSRRIVFAKSHKTIPH